VDKGRVGKPLRDMRKAMHIARGLVDPATSLVMASRNDLLKPVNKGPAVVGLKIAQTGRWKSVSRTKLGEVQWEWE
jgi:hypothetical protein